MAVSLAHSGYSCGNIIVVNNEVATIDRAHDEIHHGDYYSAHYFVSALANGASAQMLIVGSTHTEHCLITVSVQGNSTLSVYESPTVLSSGIAVTAYNNNRTNTRTSICMVYSTPNCTAGGTELNKIFVGGGRGTQATGGVSRFGTEFVLQVNTVYLVHVVNVSGSTSDTGINFEYYED